MLGPDDIKTEPNEQPTRFEHGLANAAARRSSAHWNGDGSPNFPIDLIDSPPQPHGGLFATRPTEVPQSRRAAAPEQAARHERKKDAGRSKAADPRRRTSKESGKKHKREKSRNVPEAARAAEANTQATTQANPQTQVQAQARVPAYSQAQIQAQSQAQASNTAVEAPGSSRRGNSTIVDEQTLFLQRTMATNQARGSPAAQTLPTQRTMMMSQLRSSASEQSLPVQQNLAANQMHGLPPFMRQADQPFAEQFAALPYNPYSSQMSAPPTSRVHPAPALQAMMPLQHPQMGGPAPNQSLPGYAGHRSGQSPMNDAVARQSIAKMGTIVNEHTESIQGLIADHKGHVTKIAGLENFREEHEEYLDDLPAKIEQIRADISQGKTDLTRVETQSISTEGDLQGQLNNCKEDLKDFKQDHKKRLEALEAKEAKRNTPNANGNAPGSSFGHSKRVWHVLKAMLPPGGPNYGPDADRLIAAVLSNLKDSVEGLTAAQSTSSKHHQEMIEMETQARAEAIEKAKEEILAELDSVRRLGHGRIGSANSEAVLASGGDEYDDSSDIPMATLRIKRKRGNDGAARRVPRPDFVRRTGRSLMAAGELETNGSGEHRGPSSIKARDKNYLLQTLKSADFGKNEDIINLKKALQVEHDFLVLETTSGKLFLKVGGCMISPTKAQRRDLFRQFVQGQTLADRKKVTELGVLEVVQTSQGDANPDCIHEVPAYVLYIGDLFLSATDHDSAKAQVQSTGFAVYMDITSPAKALWMMREDRVKMPSGPLWREVTFKKWDVAQLLRGIEDWTGDGAEKPICPDTKDLLAKTWRRSEPVFTIPIYVEMQKKIQEGWGTAEDNEE